MGMTPDHSPLAYADLYRGSSGSDEKNTDREDNKKKELDNIVWNQTEVLLQPAEADILEIFDWYVYTSHSHSCEGWTVLKDSRKLPCRERRTDQRRKKVWLNPKYLR